MITLGYCTLNPNEDKSFLENMESTGGDMKIIPKVGYTSICKAYNEILDESDTDIVVLCHNDIRMMTKGWNDIIVKLFDKYKNTGIIGLVGSNGWSGGVWLGNTGGKWLGGRGAQAVGHLIQGVKYGYQFPEYILFSPLFIKNPLVPVITVDGLFMAVKKSRLKARFDERLTGFHFYDVMFTVDNVTKGCMAAVTYQILVKHLSDGIQNDKWREGYMYSKLKYGDPYNVGIELPFGGREFREKYNKNQHYE